MLSYDHVLAILLLNGALDPADLGAHLELVKPTFLQLAVEAEILDEREEQFFEGLSKDLVGDVRALQKRAEALRAAPKVIEANRFPDRSLIEEFLAFSRAHRKNLTLGLEQDQSHAEQWQTAIHEVDQHYFVWSVLRDARCRFYYVTVRRQALAQLRDMVGAEAFYNAQLPPHVPLWHFPVMK